MRFRVYWSAPHRLDAANDAVRRCADDAGLDVFVPADIDRHLRVPPMTVRQRCIDAIRRSDVVFVFLDQFGMDTSWEIGFATAARRQVIGVSDDERLLDAHRIIGNRSAFDHWMHGWSDKPIADTPRQLRDLCSMYGLKRLYLSASTKQLWRSKAISSELPRDLTVTTPEDIVSGFEYVPRAEYPPGLRARCIERIAIADAMIVDMNNLTMNCSWEIGFAESLGILIIGVQFLPRAAPIHRITLRDLWMHGWCESKIVVGIRKAFELLTQQRPAAGKAVRESIASAP